MNFYLCWIVPFLRQYSIPPVSVLFEEYVLCHLVYTCVAQQTNVRRMCVKFYELDPCL